MSILSEVRLLSEYLIDDSFGETDNSSIHGEIGDEMQPLRLLPLYNMSNKFRVVI